MLDSPYAVKIIKKVWLVFEYTADKKVGKNVFCSPSSHRIYNIHPQQYYRERTMCGQVKNSLIYSFMKLHVINVTVNYADILIFFKILFNKYIYRRSYAHNFWYRFAFRIIFNMVHIIRDIWH